MEKLFRQNQSEVVRAAAAAAAAAAAVVATGYGAFNETRPLLLLLLRVSVKDNFIKQPTQVAVTVAAAVAAAACVRERKDKKTAATTFALVCLRPIRGSRFRERKIINADS